MYVQLRIGDRDTFLIKGKLYVFDKVEVYRPIVLCVAPYSYGVFESAVLMSGKTGKYCRVLKHLFVSLAYCGKSFFNLIDIAIVSGGKGKVDSSCGKCGNVGEGSV